MLSIQKIELNFLRHVPNWMDESSDTCWEYLGGRNQRGYGQFTMNYRCINAQRAAWLLFKGEIPEGQVVCHTCDNPPCVRLNHLFLGTCQQNLEDMDRKGRSCRGETSYKHSIAEETARAILAEILPLGRGLRTKKGTFLRLAVKYGTTVDVVKDIRRGKSWKWLITEGGLCYGATARICN